MEQRLFVDKEIILEPMDAILKIKNSPQYAKLKHLCKFVSRTEYKGEQWETAKKLAEEINAEVDSARENFPAENLAEFEQCLSCEMRCYCKLYDAALGIIVSKSEQTCETPGCCN